MADEPVVHIGENSPEHVAYRLMTNVLFHIEGEEWEQLERKTYLDTYAECLRAVGGSPKRPS